MSNNAMFELADRLKELREAKKTVEGEECRRDVEYMVETATIKGKLKGEEYEYTGKKAVCTECGSEVFIHS